jgi:transcriptional regulator with XRE-family HTH domain
MDERKMSISELSERADIAMNTARTLYHGINTRVDLPVIARIAAALGVSPKDVFEEFEDPPLDDTGYNEELITPALEHAA